MIKKLTYGGKLVHECSIEGETREDGYYPGHINAAQLSRNRFLILFTSREESEVKELAEEMGAEGYIIKKMNKRDIVDEVNFYFRKYCGGDSMDDYFQDGDK